jgi:tetratricopeptide (TPR) repeat protein
MHGFSMGRELKICAVVLAYSLVGHAPRAQDTGPLHSAVTPVLLKTHPDDVNTRRGFERFYNADYDDAISDFEKEQKAHPDDPSTVNHLLEAVLVRELNNEGALESSLYMGTDFLHAEKPAIAPEVRAHIQDLIGRSLSLSEQILRNKPDDADALYAHGVAKALSATYQGLVEKSWFSALRSALGAYHDHQRVLELSPDYNNAKLVVGVYNYIVATLPFYEKSVAFLFTITGSKTKGIELIRQAANAGGEASVDAKAALSLFLAREQQYTEALSLARELFRAYPRNLHFALAEADLLRASGNLPEAIARYRNLVVLEQQKKFPRDAELTRAAYSLGDTLRSEGNYAAAAEAFEFAATVSEADHTRAAKARLSAGQMYDLLKKRDAALHRYQEVIAMAGDSAEAREARHLLKQPYHLR